MWGWFCGAGFFTVTLGTCSSPGSTHLMTTCSAIIQSCNSAEWVIFITSTQTSSYHANLCGHEVTIWVFGNWLTQVGVSHDQVMSHHIDCVTLFHLATEILVPITAVKQGVPILKMKFEITILAERIILICQCFYLSRTFLYLFRSPYFGPLFAIFIPPMTKA